jgi:hypothetical protein
MKMCPKIVRKVFGRKRYSQNRFLLLLLLPPPAGCGDRFDLRHDARIVLKEGRRDAGKLNDLLTELKKWVKVIVL